MKNRAIVSALALIGAFAPLAAAPVWAQSAAPQAEEASAQSMTPEEAALIKKYKDILDSQKRQTGEVAVPGAKATLHLGEKYYFIGPGDSRRIIVDAWQNPPDAADGVIGMVFPVGANFTDSWGAVITYKAEGWVSDKDAADISANKLLEQMREGEATDNEARKKDGYPTMHVEGWAQMPTYNKAGHYAIWARDLSSSDAKEDSLNYDIRFLGRNGVLSVNMVDAMTNLKSVRAAADGLVATTAFDAGARYTDYVEGQDKKSEYTIAGLVAAGLGLAAAKKFGLLAVILLFAKKGIVLIVAALAGVGAWFKNLFRKKEAVE